MQKKGSIWLSFLVKMLFLTASVALSCYITDGATVLMQTMRLSQHTAVIVTSLALIGIAMTIAAGARALSGHLAIDEIQVACIAVLIIGSSCVWQLRHPEPLAAIAKQQSENEKLALKAHQVEIKRQEEQLRQQADKIKAEQELLKEVQGLRQQADDKRAESVKKQVEKVRLATQTLMESNLRQKQAKEEKQPTMEQKQKELQRLIILDHVMQHHEMTFNGTTYPARVVGDKILLEGGGGLILTPDAAFAGYNPR